MNKKIFKKLTSKKTLMEKHLPEKIKELKNKWKKKIK